MKDDGEDILHKMDSKTAPLSFTRLLTDGVWATNGNEFVLQPNDFADIQSKKVGLEGHENNGHKMEEAFMPAKRKAPLKNEQIIEIMKKYNEIQMENPRLRDSQIAPMLGITQNMLSYYKNRAPTGVEKKERRPYTSEEKGELMKQYMELKQAKLNDREISDKLKVSRNTLSRWKTNFGLNKD
uniref:Homeodomain-like domain-containing protein n=1 Tax=Globodera rostochiensis TaxID=31243 RepID=A0A914HRR2_GLORO